MTESLNDLREKVARKLEANPGIKTGMLADTLGVAEADVLRAMPEGHAAELVVKDLESLVRNLEALGTVYFIMRNGACVTEIKGRFGEFSKSGPFFNVSTETLHLHLRLDRIESVFHVNPAMPEGRAPMPSLQFFQSDGSVAFRVFLIESIQQDAGDDFTQSVEALKELISQAANHVTS